MIDMAGSDKVHCPLCYVSIEPPNDEGWKLHLMTGEGCPKLKKSRSPVKKAVPQQQQSTLQAKKKKPISSSKR
jgi:centrosomal protein CEP104